MSEPNDLDHTRAGYTESDLYQQLYPNGYQDGHAQYVSSAIYKLLEKHFAAELIDQAIHYANERSAPEAPKDGAMSAFTEDDLLDPRHG